jgi:nicotinamide mononucleotide transporter
MNGYDVAGFLTGVVCVWLTVRQNIWNWHWGILNSAIFLFSFLTVGLYADSALQIVYIVLGFYGWWAWLHGGPAKHELPMTRISLRMSAIVIAFTAGATWLFSSVLANQLGSTVPFWDGITTALSLAAQFLLTRKILENWFLWIAADLMYIPLYVYKHLPLTGLLYVIFLGLCVAGLMQWGAAMRRAKDLGTA